MGRLRLSPRLIAWSAAALVLSTLACLDLSNLDTAYDAGHGVASSTDGSTDGGSDFDASKPASRYAAVVLEDHPLVYLRLGETSGTEAVNEMGGPGGAYVGDAGLGVPGSIAGESNTAVRFDGTQGTSIRLGTGFNFAGNHPYSVEVWVRPEGPAGGGDNSIVEDCAFCTAGGWSLFMQFDALKFERQDVERAWKVDGLPKNQFTHVVGTFDGAALHLYVDGLNFTDAPATSSMVDTPDQHLSAGRAFPGTLDEIAVYDYALSKERVYEHHKAGVGN
jgi:hypothetical protein